MRRNFYNGLPVQHVEAFCLMYYENHETRKGFVVWNSRDGVTPFCCFEEGIEYQHQHWGMDRFMPNFQLTPGKRFFRDTTHEEALEIAQKRMEHYQDPEVEVPAQEWEETKQRVAKSIVGQPRLVTFQP